MTKMTNAVALSYVLSSCEIPQDVREKLEKMLTQVQKKNTAEKKPTATQVANESYKAEIRAFMEVNKAYTITDIMKGCAAVADLSNQRVSALVRQMVDAGELQREEIKRKAYFSLAFNEVEALPQELEA